MAGDALDPVQFMETFANLIVAARKAAQSEHPRVAVFGECAQLLWAQGNVHAAIQDEQLCNELVRIYGVDILCGYSMESPQGTMDGDVLHRICAEHAAVHGLG
jgi:hypothetical protein